MPAKWDLRPDRVCAKGRPFWRGAKIIAPMWFHGAGNAGGVAAPEEVGAINYVNGRPGFLASTETDKPEYPLTSAPLVASAAPNGVRNPTHGWTVGPGVFFETSGTGKVIRFDDELPDWSNPITWLFVMKSNSTGTQFRQCYGVDFSSEVAASSWYIQISGNTTWGNVGVASDATGYRHRSGTGLDFINTVGAYPCAAGLTYSGEGPAIADGATWTGWIDGVSDPVASDDAAAGENLNIQDTGATFLGGSSTDFGFPGFMFAFYQWARLLSDREMRTLAADPWCVVRPAMRRSFKAPVAAAVDPGAFLKQPHNPLLRM